MEADNQPTLFDEPEITPVKEAKQEETIEVHVKAHMYTHKKGRKPISNENKRVVVEYKITEAQQHAYEGYEITELGSTNSCIESAKRLDVVYNTLEAMIKERSLIHCDETPFIVMQEPCKTNTSKSYMMALAEGGHDSEHPGIVLFRYSPNRSAQSLDEVLKGYEGAVQSDAYRCYHTVRRVHHTTHRLPGTHPPKVL